jgi:hypothetical protein
MQQICSEVQALINNPPRQLESVADLYPIIKQIPLINQLLHTDKNPDACSTLAQLADALFLTTLADHYHIFLTLIPMELEHPSTGAMIICLLVGQIYVILTSLNHARAVDVSLFPTSLFASPWPSGDCPRSIIAMGLCVENRVPIGKYTVSKLLKAIRAVSMNWTTLEPSTTLLWYLLMLARRGFVVMNQPGHLETHNFEPMRKEVVVGAETYYSGNWDLLRRLSGGLVRMIAALRFRLTVAPLDRPLPTKLQCDALTKILVEEARKMEYMPTVRSESRALFNLSALEYGDMELYVENCNDDPAKPLDIIFTTKPPDIQQAWTQLNIAVIFHKLAELREDEPFFAQIYSPAYRFYSQNTKLLVVESFLKLNTINFLGDYTIPEQVFISEKLNILRADSPLLLQSMGKFHVLYKERLCSCASLEIAIIVWADIILSTMSEKLNGINISEQLNRMLGRFSIYSKDNCWDNVSDATAGLADELCTIIYE